jgi:hypothetical protein
VPGKSPEEAASYFHEQFRESLSVITDTNLQGIRKGNQHVLLFEPPAKVRVKSGGSLYIDVVQTFAVVERDGQYRAQTTSYQYSVLESETEAGDYGICSYHWHPSQTSKLRWPHLHAIPRIADKYLSHRVHLPTSRICIEDFVLVLIRDFDVSPRRPYDEWKETLMRNKTSFATYANWWAYAVNTQIRAAR